MCQKPIKMGEQVTAADRSELRRNFRTQHNILDTSSSHKRLRAVFCTFNHASVGCPHAQKFVLFAHMAGRRANTRARITHRSDLQVFKSNFAGSRFDRL